MADNVNVTQSGTTPVATEDINGVQHQRVKVTIGEHGVDGSTVSNGNPFPIELVGLFKRLFGSLAKLTYDGSGQLRTAVSGTVAVSTVTTVTTMTTGNIGFGDSGKPSTIQQISANTFYGSIGRNFTRG